MSTSRPPSHLQKNVSTLMALTGVLFITGGLIALVTMVLPQFLFVVLVFFAFIFIILFHYLAWGRWLSKQTPPEDETDH